MSDCFIWLLFKAKKSSIVHLIESAVIIQFSCLKNSNSQLATSCFQNLSKIPLITLRHQFVFGFITVNGPVTQRIRPVKGFAIVGVSWKDAVHIITSLLVITCSLVGIEGSNMVILSVHRALIFDSFGRSSIGNGT